jgi:tetratricopeptide (TPR) repeat protein
MSNTILKNRNYNHNLLRSTLLSLFALWVIVSVLSSYPSVAITALGASLSSRTADGGLDQATILNNKGMSLYNSGKFNESIAYFDKALAINPKNITALDNKGLALLSVSINNYTQAISYFDKALSIDPRNVDVLFHIFSRQEGKG